MPIHSPLTTLLTTTTLLLLPLLSTFPATTHATPTPYKPTFHLRTVTSDPSGLALTALTITQTTPGTTHLTFSITNPLRPQDGAATCEGEWETGREWEEGQDYAPCGATRFGWRVDAFAAPDSFVLGVEHGYSVSSNNSAFPIGVRVFGQTWANETKAAVWCEGSGKGPLEGGVTRECRLKEGRTIFARIWGSIA